MSIIKKVLSAAFLGSLYLFNPNPVVSATPCMDIQALHINNAISPCPMFSYFDQMPKHEYCLYSDSPTTRLFQSIKEGVKNEQIKCLIDNGADVNAVDEDERIPLHYVRDREIAQSLKDAGADINARDSEERTPLHLYLQEENNQEELIQIVEWIIANGADVNAKDLYDQTPLYYVRNKVIAQCLIDNGADVNAKNLHGQTPLYNVKNQEIAQCLIDNGADVNARDKFDRIPLHYIQDEEIVQCLVYNGADVNSTDKEGRTLLHKVKDEKMAQWLIDHGADVNALDKYNQNPLHLAETEKLATFFQDKGVQLFRGNSKDRAFVFYSSFDWNGALSSKKVRYFTSNLTLDYLVGQRTIEEYGQFIKVLDGVSFQSLKMIVIIGHGSPANIALGLDSEKGILNKRKLNLIKEQLRLVFKRTLAPNATVILHSCSTAKDKNSIAYDILKILPIGSNMIAANDIIDGSLTRYNSLKPIDLSFFYEHNDITVRVKREQTMKKNATSLPKVINGFVAT